MLFLLTVTFYLLLTTDFQLSEANIVKRNIAEYPRNALFLNDGICRDTANGNTQVAMDLCLNSITEKNYHMNIELFIQHAGITYFYTNKRMDLSRDPTTSYPAVYYQMDHPGSKCYLKINSQIHTRPLIECNLPGYIESRYYSTTKVLASGIAEICVEFYKHVPGNTPSYGSEFANKQQCESAISGNPTSTTTAKSTTTTASPKITEPTSVKIASTFLKSVTGTGSSHDSKDAIVSPLALELAAAVCVEGATVGDKTQTELFTAVFQMNTLDDFKTYAKPLKDIKTSLTVVSLTPAEKLGFANFFALDRTAVVDPDPDGDRFRYYESIKKENEFATRTDKLATSINRIWKKNAVSTAKNLLDGADLGVASKVVLVNSLYAKLDWAEPFSSANNAKFFPTAKRDPASTTTDQRMMAKAFSSLPYGETVDMQWIRVPFKDPDYSMYVVLPKNAKTVEDLKAPGSGISFIMQNPRETSLKAVDVTLPRFNIDFVKNDFENVLKATAPAAFTDTDADFTPLLGASGISITKVRHVVKLEVNEVGISGVAVLEPIAGSALRETPANKQFVADHPFMFFVTGTKSDRMYVLFAGQFFDKK